jgi:hypothetical protein
VSSNAIVIPGNLSLVELAALELTNDSYVVVHHDQRRRHAVLTSKDVYYWAPLLSFLVVHGQVSPEQVTFPWVCPENLPPMKQAKAEHPKLQ